MKKFSNITNQKVANEPSIASTKINEADVFKMQIMDLMDSLLTIQTYGPVDRYLRAGTIKISGKEMLAEAILNMLSDKSINEQTKVLESLKSEIGDWNTIDKKIDELNSNIYDKKKDLATKSILSIYEKWGSDKDSFLLAIDNSISKINSNDKAILKSEICLELANSGKYDKDMLIEASNKFKNK